ncbi:MAG: GNAT family N-acetyltransferase [Rhodocyclales bacterium GT-UBC]|nr:MAG: GNAT family N-acetyltransferase [Rhodocyclales bacterium GT-UBC]
MAAQPLRRVRKFIHQNVRKMISSLPRNMRFAIYRSFVDCDPTPDARLELKIAETRDELEACFSLLHDAYVDSGFMQPAPSGLRVTIYHALPTTTTLCAKWDGRVVGTISLIRESAFGFPLQKIFDLSPVRQKEGNLAEVSALAVHPSFRKTGGAILFPLMKFMYEYATKYFDTRHLLIAVNPNRIEMYESLLYFQRLQATAVESYEFANGAPAVGASLDLREAPELLEAVYRNKPPRKNLYDYFTKIALANLKLPYRRYFTTNDPVLTPELLNYFFNVRTEGFASLDLRLKVLLHSIYDLPSYQHVLPDLPIQAEGVQLRQHQRFSVKCPGQIKPDGAATSDVAYPVQVIEVSEFGFQAYAKDALPLNTWGSAIVQLGKKERAVVKALAVRDKANGFNGFYGFRVGEPDLIWKKFVNALQNGRTHDDLAHATLFLT